MGSVGSSVELVFSLNTSPPLYTPKVTGPSGASVPLMMLIWLRRVRVSEPRMSLPLAQSYRFKRIQMLLPAISGRIRTLVMMLSGFLK